MIIEKLAYPTPIEQFRAVIDASLAPDKALDAVITPPADTGSLPIGGSAKDASPSYLSGFGTQPPITVALAPPTNPAAARDVAGTVQEAARQIARANTGVDIAIVDLRSALDAYRTANMNRDEFERQAQSEAGRSLNITG